MLGPPSTGIGTIIVGVIIAQAMAISDAAIVQDLALILENIMIGTSVAIATVLRTSHQRGPYRLSALLVGPQRAPKMTRCNSVVIIVVHKIQTYYSFSIPAFWGSLILVCLLSTENVLRSGICRLGTFCGARMA